MSEYMRQFMVALIDYERAYICMEELIELGHPTDEFRSVLKGYRNAVIAAAKQLEGSE